MNQEATFVVDALPAASKSKHSQKTVKNSSLWKLLDMDDSCCSEKSPSCNMVESNRHDMDTEASERCDQVSHDMIQQQTIESQLRDSILDDVYEHRANYSIAFKEPNAYRCIQDTGFTDQQTPNETTNHGDSNLQSIFPIKRYRRRGSVTKYNLQAPSAMKRLVSEDDSPDVHFGNQKQLPSSASTFDTKICPKAYTPTYFFNDATGSLPRVSLDYDIRTPLNCPREWLDNNLNDDDDNEARKKTHHAPMPQTMKINSAFDSTFQTEGKGNEMQPISNLSSEKRSRSLSQTDEQMGKGSKKKVRT